MQYKKGIFYEGEIIGVYRSEMKNTLESAALDTIEVDETGIVGDKHNGVLMKSDARQTAQYARGTVIRNNRHWSAVSVEELAEAVKTDGKSIWKDVEKAISLAIIDDEWKEHLRSMDELKESVQGASFEQKDPLMIYKVEAYSMFEQFVGKVNMEVTSYLSKGMLMIQQDEPTLQQAPMQKTNFGKTNADLERMNEERRRMREAAATAGSEPQRPVTLVREEPKVGRNGACPCGSGKKFKNCHGVGA